MLTVWRVFNHCSASIWLAGTPHTSNATHLRDMNQIRMPNAKSNIKGLGASLLTELTFDAFFSFFFLKKTVLHSSQGNIKDLLTATYIRCCSPAVLLAYPLFNGFMLYPALLASNHPLLRILKRFLSEWIFKYKLNEKIKFKYIENNMHLKMKLIKKVFLRNLVSFHFLSYRVWKSGEGYDIETTFLRFQIYLTVLVKSWDTLYGGSLDKGLFQYRKGLQFHSTRKFLKSTKNWKKNCWCLFVF